MPSTSAVLGGGDGFAVGFQHSLNVVLGGDTDAGVLCAEGLGHGAESLDNQACPALRGAAVVIGASVGDGEGNSCSSMPSNPAFIALRAGSSWTTS